MFHQKYFKLRVVQTRKDIDNFIKLFKKAKKVFFDTETSGLEVRWIGKDYLVGYTFAFEDEVSKDVFYIPVRHDFTGKFNGDGRFGNVEKYFNVLGAKEGKSFNDYFPDFNPLLFEGNYVNIDNDYFIFKLKPLIEGGGKEYIAHHISFDLHLLANEGIDVFKMFEVNTFMDTQIACHTIDEEQEKKLEKITETVFSIKKSDFSNTISTVTSAEKRSLGLKPNSNASFQHVQIPIGGQYSAEDVYFMKQLYYPVLDGLERDGSLKIFWETYMPFMKVLWKMERRGIKIDLEKLDHMTKLALDTMDKLSYEIYEIVGVKFNIKSNQQISEILYGFKKRIRDKKNGGYKESFNEDLVKLNFGFKPVDWTAGGVSKDEKLKTPKSDKDALKKLLKQRCKKEGGHRLVELLQIYFKLDKLCNTFMIGLKDSVYCDGKIHCSYNQNGTDSKRISSSEPNLLNLPKPLEEPSEGDVEGKKYYDFWIRFEIRSLFIADTEEECVIAADYHALEKFITAHFSQDPLLLKMLREKLDPHGTVATLIFPELKGKNPNEIKKIAPHKRQVGKTVGFAVDYGGTKKAVARNLECDEMTAQTYIDRYFEGFAGLKKYIRELVGFARKNGYITTAFTAHKRHLWGINSKDGATRSYYERVAVNSKSQGSGADVIMAAQTDIDNDVVLNSIGAKMVIQCYDEIVMTCPIKYKSLCMERLVYHMEHCMPKRGVNFTIPLEAVADFGRTYAEAK